MEILQFLKKDVYNLDKLIQVLNEILCFWINQKIIKGLIIKGVKFHK